MNTAADNSRSSALLTLMLFLVFAICILAVLMGSTGIYERIAQRSAESEDRRVTAMFVAAKVRQNDAQGCVRVEDMEGCDALVLNESLGTGKFCTWIYCHEGWLYEILVPEKVTPKAGDGEKLIRAQELRLELEDALLSIDIVDAHGQSSSGSIMLRSGGTSQ